MGFAGECRFLDFEVVRGEEPAVGGDAVARLKQHDVAGHQLAGVDFDEPAVAPHAGPRGEHVLQCRERAFGAVLLVEAERSVQQHDDEDHHRILEFADRPGEDGGEYQDDHEEVPELIDELEPHRPRCRFGEPVRAEAREPLGDLFSAQAADGVQPERLGGGLGGQGVPAAGFGSHEHAVGGASR